MTIEVTSQVIEAIRSATEHAHPEEACGILFGETSADLTRITNFTRAANVHPRPTTHFEIDPQALVDAQRAWRAGGPQIIGYFHSHPKGPARPSETDRAMAPGDGRIWAIAGDLLSEDSVHDSAQESERDDQSDTLAQLGLHFEPAQSDTFSRESDTLAAESDTSPPKGVTFWQDGEQGFTPLSYMLAKG